MEGTADVGVTVDLESSVTIIPVLVSGIYWLEGSSQIEPYIGAGLGLAFISWEVSIENDSEDDSATPFIFQVFAGAEYPMSQNMSLFGEAGYLIGSFDVKINDLDFDQSVSIGGFGIKAGAKFYLN